MGGGESFSILLGKEGWQRKGGGEGTFPNRDFLLLASENRRKKEALLCSGRTARKTASNELPQLPFKEMHPGGRKNIVLDQGEGAVRPR